MTVHRWRLTVLTLSLAAVPLIAQDAARRLTAEDYARAERFLAPNVAPLVAEPRVLRRGFRTGVSGTAGRRRRDPRL